jgi:ABC-type nickel/cobalt efflux system permease component RcnA
MNAAPQLLLVAAVGAVGVLHTMVPDHWAPLALFARQRGWSKAETAWRALQAGTGHVVSTLALALVFWLVGVAAAARYGSLVEALSSLALVLFGGWIALAAWRELHPPGHHHDHGHHHHHRGDHGTAAQTPLRDPLYLPLPAGAAALVRHAHPHRHGPGLAHSHWHDHTQASAHPVAAALASQPPLHAHRHRMTPRTAALLVLGSSPMVEGIPAFFAAAKYGAGLILVMAGVFALSTILTYLALCLASVSGLERLRFGALERYGEVLSGAFIAFVGVLFGVWPLF